MVTLEVMSDPLKITAELGCLGEFCVLGFPVRVACNEPAVIGMARDLWGARRPPADQEVRPTELRVLVESGDGELRPPVFRACGHLITITAGESFAVCDHTRNFVFCRLSERALADPDYVRYYFLDAAVLFTLTQLYVTPVHAAAVAMSGRGLLLCGESGAGKSTLAYACAQRGWTYVSDNESWLLRSDARTVLGNPARIRLRDRASEIFPELAGRPAVTFNGKQTIVLASDGFETADSVRPSHMVFLSRGDAEGVSMVDREEAFARLFADVICYSPEVREAHRESLEKFTADVPAVKLRYRGIEDGVSALERLLG